MRDPCFWCKGDGGFVDSKTFHVEICVPCGGTGIELEPEDPEWVKYQEALSERVQGHR